MPAVSLTHPHSRRAWSWVSGQVTQARYKPQEGVRPSMNRFEYAEKVLVPHDNRAYALIGVTVYGSWLFYIETGQCQTIEIWNSLSGLNR